MKQFKIDPRFAGLKDASRYAGVSERTLRYWIHDGHISAFKLSPGKRAKFLIDLKELTEYVRSQRYKPKVDGIVDEVVSEFCGTGGQR